MNAPDLLRFNALRNALYHTARRRFFELWNRIFNFMVVILGAAAMGDAAAKYGFDQLWIGLAVPVVAAAQLVFDFGRSARDYQALQRDYYNLLADIEENTNPTAKDRASWKAKMTRISADEPPTLRAIDAKAYNDAIDAMEIFDADQKLHIPALHKIFGWFWAYDGYSYQKQCEHENFRHIRALGRWITKVWHKLRPHSAASQ